MREDATGGVFLSTSGFTRNVGEGLTEVERPKVRIGDGGKIHSICKAYYKVESAIWIADQDLTAILHEQTIVPAK